MNVDTFGEYVRRRLDDWGHEFSLSRDCEYLGHQSKNVLQVLIEHKGEMPGRTQGFKPLEVSPTAHQIELIISGISRTEKRLACVMRAYYCGSGRRRVERYETANLLLAYTGSGVVTLHQYRSLHEIGLGMVRSDLIGLAKAA